MGLLYSQEPAHATFHEFLRFRNAAPERCRTDGEALRVA